jgi:hypothetical protein
LSGGASSGVRYGKLGQETVKIVVGHAEAPFGLGSARISFWVTPARSVARACTVWLHGDETGESNAASS